MYMSNSLNLVEPEGQGPVPLDGAGVMHCGRVYLLGMEETEEDTCWRTAIGVVLHQTKVLWR